MFDIYLIQNTLNGKRYVGYTSKGFEKRFLKHLNESVNGSSRYLCRAIRKYGKDSFTISLLDTALTHEEAVKKEIRYIKSLKTFAHAKGNHGYNATIGGDGANGLNVPKSTRMKISDIKKKQLAWVGERNPKFNKGYLICGDNHPMFGKRHSSQAKNKISQSNRGRLAGLKNPSVKSLVCYSLEHATGIILKFDSFFEMRQHFQKNGLTLNRSSVLAVMRGDHGYRSYHGYFFYREDVTPSELFCEIEYKYQNGITVPVELSDHRQGKSHPNAKSVMCFAENIETGELFMFDSWYELKHGLEMLTQKTLTYSNMSKCLTGKYKHIAGYRLFRKDKTEESTFANIITKFNEQTEPSTTSREA